MFVNGLVGTATLQNAPGDLSVCLLIKVRKPGGHSMFHFTIAEINTGWTYILFKGGSPKKTCFWRHREGGTSPEFFIDHFLVSFGHVGAGGVQMQNNDIFFWRFCLLKRFCDDRKQRQNLDLLNVIFYFSGCCLDASWYVTLSDLTCFFMVCVRIRAAWWARDLRDAPLGQGDGIFPMGNRSKSTIWGSHRDVRFFFGTEA